MLEPLNERGVKLIIGTDTVPIPKDCARLALDADGQLSMTAVVPIEQFSLYTKLGKKWKFGILAPQMDFGERPEKGQRPEGAPKGDRQGPPPGGGMGGPGGGMGGPGGGMGGPGGGPRRGMGGIDLSNVDDSKLEKALTKEISDWVTIKYSEFNK